MSKVALRQIDQMRAVVGEFLAERGSRGEEAGMAAHHHRDIDAGQGGVVEIGAGEGLGDEARRRGKARRVVVADEIVVDGLGNMDAAQGIIGLGRLFADDAHGVGGIVAADIEEGADLMRLKHLEDLVAIFGVGLVAGRAQRRGRRVGDHFQVVGGLLGQVEQIFVDDAAHAMMGAIDAAPRRRICALPAPRPQATG